MPKIDVIESDFVMLINSQFPIYSRLYKLNHSLVAIDGNISTNEFNKRATLIKTPNNLEYTLPISTMRILFTDDFIDVD